MVEELTSTIFDLRTTFASLKVLRSHCNLEHCLLN